MVKWLKENRPETEDRRPKSGDGRLSESATLATGRIFKWLISFSFFLSYLHQHNRYSGRLRTDNVGNRYYQIH